MNRDGVLTSADSGMVMSETRFILGGGTDASLDPALIPATRQIAVPAAGGPAVAGPSVASPQQAQAKVQTSANRTVFGPNRSTFNLAASMDRFNAMRIVTPADELAERFLKGAPTGADAAPQPAAEERWKIKLPTLTQAVKVRAQVEAGAGSEGVLQALKHLVARKLGRRLSLARTGADRGARRSPRQ